LPGTKKTALKKSFRKVLDGDERERSESNGTELDDHLGSLSPVLDTEIPQPSVQDDFNFNISSVFETIMLDFPPPPPSLEPYPSVGAPPYPSVGAPIDVAPPSAGSSALELARALMSRIEEEQVSNKQSLEDKIKSLSDEKQALEETNLSLKDKIKSLSDEKQALEETNLSLKDKIKSLSDEKQALEETNLSLKDKIKSLSDEKQALEETKQTAEEKVKSLYNTIHEIETKSDEELKKAQEDLKQMRVKLQKNIEMGRKVEESREVFKKTNQDQEATIKELQDRLLSQEKNDKAHLELEIKFQNKIQELEKHSEEMHKKYKKYKSAYQSALKQKNIASIEIVD
jgi:predicted  nucleic acid-binding Zn-ribbon protein